MLVSIVVITRNRPNVLEKCLEQLRGQVYKPIEIIVVDSSTTNETKELILQKFPSVQYLYLENGKNKMPVSRNEGLKYANGEIICFLDDDSMASQQWVVEIVKTYTVPAIGCVGGMVLEPYGPKEEADHGRPIGKVLCNAERVTNYHLNPGKTIDVDLVRGCNMSFRREVIEKIGGFDPAYTGTNAFEAGDYCIRVKNAGYRILFNPNAKVLHLSAPREDIPRELSDPRSQFYNARNWTLWVGKNLTWKRSFRQYVLLGQSFEILNRKELTRYKRFIIFVSNLMGKFTGIIAWMQWRYFKKREPFIMFYESHS